jgi:hypothetical protein
LVRFSPTEGWRSPELIVSTEDRIWPQSNSPLRFAADLESGVSIISWNVFIGAVPDTFGLGTEAVLDLWVQVDAGPTN